LRESSGWRLVCNNGVPLLFSVNLRWQLKSTNSVELDGVRPLFVDFVRIQRLAIGLQQGVPLLFSVDLRWQLKSTNSGLTPSGARVARRRRRLPLAGGEQW
jgi:hypothetical protein